MPGELDAPPAPPVDCRPPHDRRERRASGLLVSRVLRRREMTPAAPQPALGAEYRDGSATFRVYSTVARRVTVEVEAPGRAGEQSAALTPAGDSVYVAELEGVSPGSLYTFRLDGRPLPDPYARWLPRGVHGPAAVVDPRYPWKHPPRVRPLEETVFYEMHVGTFTKEGTYRAAREHLAELAALGVTTLELMPLAAFPGRRGWGYDGVAPFAPYPGYGRPDDLREFVDEAHGLGLAVVLDVVYNHFGPEGNYLASYSPEYFTEGVRTPWGAGPDFTNPHMRALLLSSACAWLTDYRFDGLRLDAIQTLVDPSPRHILRELADAVHDLSPARLLVAEDDRNLPSVIDRLGIDAVWADDFHHQLHVLATGEQDGYYACFRPSVADLAQVVRRGWLYEGQTWGLTGASRGQSALGLSPSRLVLSIQNHDQVGNRAFGDRLFAGDDSARLAAATMLLLFLPTTPLLFMGQEWGASSPFLYFTDLDPALGAGVLRGRRDEFRRFAAFGEEGATSRIPDPQAEDTFDRSKLDWAERASPASRKLLAITRFMLRLRREDDVLRTSSRDGLDAWAVGRVLVVVRGHGERRFLVVNFDRTPSSEGARIVPDGAQLVATNEFGIWSGQRLGPYGAALFRVR